MRARFPVAKGGPVTTAAELTALRKLQLTSVARLQQLQVRLIMTIVTIVVPLMPPVMHHDFLVLLRKDNLVILVIRQRHWFGLVMARVTIKPGNILAGLRQIRVRLARRGDVQKVSIDERIANHRSGAAPEIENESGRQREKEKCDACQRQGGRAAPIKIRFGILRIHTGKI